MIRSVLELAAAEAENVVHAGAAIRLVLEPAVGEVEGFDQTAGVASLLSVQQLAAEEAERSLRQAEIRSQLAREPLAFRLDLGA